MMRKIIFCRNIGPKEDIIPSTRRLAQGLVNSGWLVAWIWGPLPLSIIYKIKRGYGDIGIDSYLKGGIWINKKFWEYIPLTLNPYLKFSPDRWLNEMLIKTYPKLSLKLRSKHFDKPDVLCISSPGLVSALKSCTPKLIIYHCPVAYWKFNKITAPLLRAHEYLLKEADITIIPSETAKKELLQLYHISSKKIEVIEHGADVLYLKDVYNAQLRDGIVLVGIPQTTDFNLLSEIVKKNQNLQLKIIGPFSKNEKKFFKGQKNVNFYGLLHHSQTMQILKKSKVGLVCYSAIVREKTFADNIMKLYDYAVAGLPIVSVPIIGYAKYNKLPVRIATNSDEFADQINFCLNNWNALSQQSIEFAMKCSWETRCNQFIKVIEKRL